MKTTSFPYRFFGGDKGRYLLSNGLDIPPQPKLPFELHSIHNMDFQCFFNDPYISIYIIGIYADH